MPNPLWTPDLPWTSTLDLLPPDGQLVETKIDTPPLGPRDVRPLKRQGSLWYLPDGAMYVSYTPTHWRPILEVQVRTGY